MEYVRRRKRSRGRKGYTGKNYRAYRHAPANSKPTFAANVSAVLLPLLAFVAVVYLLLGTELKSKSSIIFKNLPKGCEGNQQAAELYENEKAVTTEDPSGYKTENTEKDGLLASENSMRVTLPRMELFMLQMGVYSTPDNCIEQSEALKNLGAAGYVYNDNGSYRVIAAAYSDKESADGVCKRLNDEGYNCTVYHLSCTGADLLITAGEESLAGISDAFSFIGTLIQDLDNISGKFDSGEIDASKATEMLSSLADRAASSSANLKTYAQGNELLLKISEHADHISNRINDILPADGNISTAEYSSKVKSLRIYLSINYISLLLDICNQ